jgi:hypothetical protein
MQPTVLTYRIDASDRLVRVNATWTEFALANQSAQISADNVLGQVLWSFISDEAVRDIYRRLVALTRQGRKPRFRYRCDSAGLRRVFEMHLTGSADASVEFCSELQTEEPRTPIPLLDPTQPRSEIFIRVCSWCHAVAWPGESWTTLEAAAERLMLTHEAAQPQLTHGICEPCAAQMFNYVGQL